MATTAPPVEEQAARSFLAFAEDAGRGLRGRNASLWRDRLQSRFQELEAAFDWLLDRGHTADALALASTLAEPLRTTGRVATGRRWLDRALEAAAIDDPLRAVALYQNGLLAFWQGADEEACGLHGRSLELARRLGDRATVALALCGLARVALREDLEWARTLCEEALQTVQDTDDTVGRSNALHVLGVAAQMRGDLRQARDLMAQRIELAREVGDVASIGMESSNLSMVERQLGNLARAEQLTREALQIEEQRGDEWAIPYSLNGLAAVAVETGSSNGRPRCWVRRPRCRNGRGTRGRPTRRRISSAAARPSEARSRATSSSGRGPPASGCRRRRRSGMPSHRARAGISSAEGPTTNWERPNHADREPQPSLRGRGGQARRTAPVQGMLRMPNQLRQASGPGWALVADAGYHRDAVTAYGISDAFHHAELLAVALDQALAGEGAAALARYQRQRDQALRGGLRTHHIAQARGPASTGPLAGGYAGAGVSGYTRQEVAQQAGVDPDYVDRLVELGILTPDAGDAFSPGDVRRARWLRSLEQAGVPLDGMAAAVRDGALSLSFLGLTAFDRFTGLTGTTFQELSARTGIPLELLTVVREAVGFAQPRPEDQVNQYELSVVPVIELQLATGFRPVVIERWLRVCGDSLRRIAETETGWWHSEVEVPLLASGMAEREMLQAQADLGSRMAPLTEQAFLAIYHGQQEHAWTQGFVEHVESALERAGLHSRLRRPPAVCFLDITGYTRLTEERGDEAAADLAARLAGLVRRSSQEHGGTPVKWLGDGVMFYFREPAAAVLAAVEMVEMVGRHGLPPAHVGIHAGPVVFQEGDYFGRTVNLAARIADYARPGEVLVSQEVVDAADAGPVTFTEIGPVELKGVPGTLRLHTARRRA